MKSAPEVTFRSNFFAPIPGEEEETNPGIYGKALAQWIQEQINRRGVETEGIVAEDWGWLVMVHRKPFMLWIGCGNVQDEGAQWRLFPVAEPTMWQRISGSGKGPRELAVTMLTSFLKDVVQTIPEVDHIEWS